MAKKNMTIDDLAQEMRGGFSAVDKKFDVVDKKFDVVDKKFDDFAGMVQRGFGEMDKRFNGIEERFNEFEKRFDEFAIEVNHRFDRLEKIIFHEYKERIEKLEDQIKDLQADFRQLVGFKK